MRPHTALPRLADRSAPTQGCVRREQRRLLPRAPAESGVEHGRVVQLARRQQRRTVHADAREQGEVQAGTLADALTTPGTLKDALRA